MKAALLIDRQSIRIQEVPAPEIVGDHDVLLRTESVGVCGSDIHYYMDGRIGDQVVAFPYRLGHEFGARVEEVGSSVTTVHIGDRVAVDPAIPCGSCSQCLADRENTCLNLNFLGCPGQAEGCLSEYIVMPEKCCFPVPGHLSPEHAAIVEPISIGIYAVQSSFRVQDATVGILGSGPIGLSVLLPSLAGGASAVYVTDRIDERVDIAGSAGAAWAGNPDKVNVVEEIREREPELLDVVYECCGQQEALDQAIELLKPGGKLMIVGIPSVNRISFSMDEMRRKEICVQNVRRQNGCMEAAIEFVATNDVEFLITHRFEMEQANLAFDLVANYRDGVVKAMVMP